MSQTAATSSWVSEYDYPSRRVSLTLANPAVVGHPWSGIRKDQLLSDPGGDFDVFVTHSPDHQVDQPVTIVKIVAALDDEGAIKSPHPDFDPISIGSPTIWPFKVIGERMGLAHWVWWVPDQVFRRSPRPWAEALRDR